MDNEPENTRDTFKEADRKYLRMVVLTLVVGGGLLTGLVFGPESLITAVPCLLGGAAMIGIPWLILTGMKWIADKTE